MALSFGKMAFSVAYGPPMETFLYENVSMKNLHPILMAHSCLEIF
jgi:hypothetical protein